MKVIYFNYLVFAATSQEIAENTFPSVVLMLMKDKNNQPLSLESGFFVEDSILASDRKRDLALVKIEGDGFPVLSKGNCTNLSVGEKNIYSWEPYGIRRNIF
ncbi:MAG: hypothetical protein ACOCV1_06940 [Bacillota bacterium]